MEKFWYLHSFQSFSYHNCSHPVKHKDPLVAPIHPPLPSPALLRRFLQGWRASGRSSVQLVITLSKAAAQYRVSVGRLMQEWRDEGSQPSKQESSVVFVTSVLLILLLLLHLHTSPTPAPSPEMILMAFLSVQVDNAKDTFARLWNTRLQVPRRCCF